MADVEETPIIGRERIPLMKATISTPTVPEADGRQAPSGAVLHHEDEGHERLPDPVTRRVADATTMLNNMV